MPLSSQCSRTLLITILHARVIQMLQDSCHHSGPWRFSTQCPMTPFITMLHDHFHHNAPWLFPLSPLFLPFFLSFSLPPHLLVSLDYLETTQLYANPLWRTPSEGTTLSLWHLPLVHSSKALFRWALTLPAGEPRVAPPLPHLSIARWVTGTTIFFTIPGLQEVGFLLNTSCYRPFSLCSRWPIPKQFLPSH